ncbi:MAG TPA: hypothetical protein VGR35_01030 [Tepidisphaeraceae bacterium]|nr:hypothetical protein [Tepidisphaeraceae bacterium]
MKRLLLTGALATCVLASTASFAQSKRDPDVNKTLERAYPGARTEVTGVETVNGVKVFNVNVSDKRGQSTAQVTEFGDFLSYGASQPWTETAKMVQNKLGQMFQAKPEDIQLFRSTSYVLDVPVQGQQDKKHPQTYRIRFDSVGRVIDIEDAEKVAADRPSEQPDVKDEKLAKQLEQIARERYIGEEPQLQRVVQSDVPGFYEVDFKGGAVTLNEKGQILRIREDVPGTELPLPVRKAIDELVKSSLRAQRVEEEYFQFTQQSPSGNEVVVKMRPDGDIIDVVNQQAQQEEQAVTAKHRQKGGGAQKKQPGS